jgi:hypothetical protein
VIGFGIGSKILVVDLIVSVFGPPRDSNRRSTDLAVAAADTANALYYNLEIIDF